MLLLPPLSSFGVSYRNKLGCRCRALPLSGCHTTWGWEGWRFLFRKPLVLIELRLSQASGPARAPQGLLGTPLGELTKESGEETGF